MNASQNNWINKRGTIVSLVETENPWFNNNEHSDNNFFFRTKNSSGEKNKTQKKNKNVNNIFNIISCILFILIISSQITYICTHM